LTPYQAPIADMTFVLGEVVGMADIAALPGLAEVTPDLVAAVLGEAGRFAGDVLAPLNASGDREGSRLANGVVTTPAGFADAYRRFIAGGWNGVPFDPTAGGQGLPWTLAIALHEMWNAANLSFALCPLLTQGAIELLDAHATPAQRATYLAPLVAGRWTGTMNLTEPQAGTDLGAIRTRAARDGDRYRIAGQKIFITFGEHDLAENIVHMVLARLPDAPPGIKGISLFIVPKFLPRADGSAGERNDLRCVALEHKLGIHASPTCVMAYGDGGGATGFLVGEENRGIEYMFTMMNNARLGVGVQGLAIAERAYQQARAQARARVQGRAAGSRDPAPIIRHPDVRRQLMTMRALTEAMRALAYEAAAALDRAKRLADPAAREHWQRRVDLLIPVVKAWCTDMGCEVASLGVQVHGGMGFIEETGAAQYYRDSRIAPIYEGTNGIQAIDLVGRKLMRDRGAAMQALIAEQRRECADAGAIGGRLAEAIDSLARATDWLVATYPGETEQALAGATPYLRLCGTVAGGALLARSARLAASRLAERPADSDFLASKLVTARFYAENILPLAGGLADVVIGGGASTLALAEDQF
jgi:3-(methylthio)propanoyl-CoA dehydrogenase